MLRIRWSDPEPEHQATPLAWSSVAMLVAPLFLNFSFWYEHGNDIRAPGPLMLFAGVVAFAALLITALFFAGPALASHTAKQPLFPVIESSFGSLPAVAIRLCCVCLVVLWTADLVSWPASRYLWLILQHDPTRLESGAIAAAIAIFLFVTALQSSRTNIKLAVFTNKLALAILLAALIRVDQGLPQALKGFAPSAGYSAIRSAANGVSDLAFYVGPLVFLAADYGRLMEGRKQLALASAWGIVVPLCVTVLLTGIIGLATFASYFYQPSLSLTVAMALWSKVASRALPGSMMIVAVSTFGAGRFGVRALVNLVASPNLGPRLERVFLACLCGMVAWCSLRPFDAHLIACFRATAACLTVTAAVLTADFLSGAPRERSARRIDWVASSALAAGLAAALTYSRASQG